ncbi:MAG: hypothetical protein ACYCS4_14050 [Acidimicrobiales bacterium]
MRREGTAARSVVVEVEVAQRHVLEAFFEGRGAPVVVELSVDRQPATMAVGAAHEPFVSEGSQHSDPQCVNSECKKEADHDHQSYHDYRVPHRFPTFPLTW